MSGVKGPDGFPEPADGQCQDWFELFNPNNGPVNLSGYFLTDHLSVPDKWAIPTNTPIVARGFLLVWADENGSQNGPGHGDLHADFKLSGSGEALGLFAPDGSPSHVMNFGAQLPNLSQGVFPGGDPNAVYLMTNWTPRAAHRLDALPAPVMTHVVLLEGNAESFTVPALPNRAYRVDDTSDRGAPLWTPLAYLHAAGDTRGFTHAPAVDPCRSFRIVVLP